MDQAAMASGAGGGLMAIEVGKRYRNKHTGIVCEVSQKIFFNIQYFEVDDSEQTYPLYCHYKRFQKHWEAV
jgi:hypothetical protein